MRLMSYWMDIVHRNNEWLIDADYVSRIDDDTLIDPLLANHVSTAATLHHKFGGSTGEMSPANIPGFRQPRRRQLVRQESGTPGTLVSH